jgi:hypothetical protein
MQGLNAEGGGNVAGQNGCRLPVASCRLFCQNCHPDESQDPLPRRIVIPAVAGIP